MITVPSVPGKLTIKLSNPFIYKCVVGSLVGMHRPHTITIVGVGGNNLFMHY